MGRKEKGGIPLEVSLSRQADDRPRKMVLQLYGLKEAKNGRKKIYDLEGWGF